MGKQSIGILERARDHFEDAIDPRNRLVSTLGLADRVRSHLEDLGDPRLSFEPGKTIGDRAKDTVLTAAGFALMHAPDSLVYVAEKCADIVIEDIAPAVEAALALRRGEK